VNYDDRWDIEQALQQARDGLLEGGSTVDRARYRIIIQRLHRVLDGSHDQD
jgi:hypothetical protein